MKSKLLGSGKKAVPQLYVLSHFCLNSQSFKDRSGADGLIIFLQK
jgi:hypothetical protein